MSSAKSKTSELCKLLLILHLVAVQGQFFCLVECSLTSVMGASPSLMARPTSASGPMKNAGGGPVYNSLQVSLPKVAERISDATSNSALQLKSDGFAAQPFEPIESSDPVKQPSAISRLGGSLKSKLLGMMHSVVAPTKSYVDLINRYHKWFAAYRHLQAEAKHPLRDAMDVLKDEYAKADELLIEEDKAARWMAEQKARAKAGPVDGSAANQNKDNGDAESYDPIDPDTGAQASSPVQQQDNVKRVENMDFVFRVLRVLIDRLEKVLEELRERENLPYDPESVRTEQLDPEELERNEERVKRAMDRAKQTAMNSAKNLLTGEMAIIARTAAFNGLAQYMAAKPDTGDVLDQLRPIISLLGSASTPVLVSYLMGIEFRTAMAVINQANPLGHLFGIGMKQQKDENLVAAR